ncbi:B- and T-lymphocyte attenuator-like [Pempheris klunzingeri]|uniref:B- and T-lymphocyte attenuator-like n=1 Tax=Pempheris klunzingeri TaxID=3127111 RepID=UPI00397F8BAC
MNGGFLTIPIMRPNHCWTCLHVFILAAQLLTLNADSEDSNCEIEIRIHRGTHYEASHGEELRIQCPVVFCNNQPPTVSWNKIGNTSVPVIISSHIKTEWITLNHSQGTASLVFQNVLRSDSGVYQCLSGGSVGHVIIVSVDDSRPSENTTVTQKTDTNSPTMAPEPTENVWMYVYTAAGIVAFVVIVIIISVASMQGCKGKPKKDIQTDNQYMAIPMVEQPLQDASLQSQPRGSPSELPSRRSTRRKRPPSQPNEMPLPRDNEHVYGKGHEDRERQGKTVEEEGSLVYAALNHQLPPRAAVRPRRPMEETSEYAAIRVKDPASLETLEDH